jgi:hypothetical protein
MTKLNNEERGYRRALALQFGATLSVLSLVAVIAVHSPRTGHELAGANAPEAATAPAANGAATNPATPDGKLYYFPSEYELHAPAQAEEQPPTF